MENKLKSLFDYQRFAKNPRLEKLIAETENSYGQEISDDDLSFISAAGEIETPSDIQKKDERENNGIL